MNKIEKQELERMNGVDPYEDEVEDGVPGWLYALLLAVLMMFTWIGDWHPKGENAAATLREATR